MTADIFFDPNLFINSDFFYGSLGFCGFEAIRTYKHFTSNKKTILYNCGSIGIICIIISLAIFSGLIADIFAAGDLGKSLFIGFSVPTGLKLITGKDLQERLDGMSVEDFSWRKVNYFLILKKSYIQYFTF